MIAKIIRGAEFVAPCFYALRGELKRPEVLAANGVRTSSAGEMAADFELQRSARPGLRQAVEHIALAWPPGETAKLTNNEVMVQAAILYLRERDIDPAKTQWALVRHHDQEHPHCHLLLNRVTDDGQVLSDKHSHHVNAAACRKVEAAMGFVDAAQLGAAAKLREAEQGKLPADLAERVQCKALIRRALQKHLPAVTTIKELSEALAADGVRMTSKLQNDGRLHGFVFQVDAYPGLHVKGSEIAREYSDAGLRQTLEVQAQHRERMPVTTELPQQPVFAVVPEPLLVQPATPLASTRPVASALPVSSGAVTASVEGREEIVVPPAEASTKLPLTPAAGRAPAIPQPEQNVLPLVPADAIVPLPTGTLGSLACAQEALALPTAPLPLGRVGQADVAPAASPAEGVAQPSLLPSAAPEVVAQGEEQRKAEQQAVTSALVGMERELAFIEAKTRDADQAERVGDYGLVAELRYGPIQEAQQRLATHQEQGSATPEGKIAVDKILAREQERLRVAMQVEAAAQQRLADQRLVDLAREAADAARTNEQRRADAAMAAWQQAQQQVTGYRTQLEAARERRDYGLVGPLRDQKLPGAEREMQRCEAVLRATPGAEVHVAQVEAYKKDQLEQARAAYERQELAKLERFRGQWPYPGTHIRLQVPAEYLPTVRGAIGRNNSIHYDNLEEHADKTTSARVVDGKVAVNVLYRREENDAKLDDALREFRRNGVEVFEQPADRNKREQRATNARAFEREYAEKMRRSSALPGKEMDRPSQIEM